MNQTVSETRKLNILLVEDTDEHALLIKRGLEDGLLNPSIFRVKDGEEAIDFLFHRGAYASPGDYPVPGIILLDLRLPKISGLEVLEKIKSDERLKDIPVVVLTVSDQRDDILRATRIGAKSYILKSVAIAPKTEGTKGILDAIISLV